MPSLNTGNAILSNPIKVDSSYNVGIGGAASGSFKLQVTGTGNFTGALSGTSAAFSGNLTIGNPSSVLAQFHIYNSSAAASMLVQTNSAADYSEIAARNFNQTSTCYYRQYSSSASGTDFGASRANLAALFSNYASNFAIGTQNGGDLILGTANTERMRITASTGAATFSSTISAGVITGDSNSTGVPSIVAKVGSGGNSGTYGFGNSSAYRIRGGSDYGKLIFDAGTSDQMTLTSGGNVLIGASTTSDSVSSRIYARQATDGDFKGLVLVSASAGEFAGSISMDSSGNLSLAHSYLAGGGSYQGIKFLTSGSERMRITSGGGMSYLGPFISMDAAGLGGSPAGLGYGLFPYSGIGLGISSVVGMRFLTGSTPTDRMSIDSSGNIGAPTGSNIYNASDRRLKQNIKTITNGLDKIIALNPVKFNWINNFVESENDKDMLGFIAQEVDLVIPEAVEKFSDNIQVGDLTINDSLRVNEKFIIPVLVKAIQELNQTVQNQQQQINSLINR